ncbi:MAG: protein-L-isoaspartate O-methyltransferase family protein [Francisellaceae bacterium]
MNIEYAKENMIKQQIRTLGIPYGELLDAIIEIPREAFLPKNMKTLAYSEAEIPLNHNQFAMAPQMIVKILKVLDLKSHNHVLEVGTGCGYLTALMAKLSKMVETFDIHEDFINHAKHTIKSLGIYNIKYRYGDAFQLLSSENLYDVIVVTSAQKTLDSSLLKHLVIGGRMLIIVDHVCYKTVMMITKSAEDQHQQQVLFDIYEDANQKQEDHKDDFQF